MEMWKKTLASMPLMVVQNQLKKDRLPRILKIQEKFKDSLAPEELAFVTFSLEEILLKKWTSKEEKAQMKAIREDLIHFVHNTGNKKTHQRD